MPNIFYTTQTKRNYDIFRVKQLFKKLFEPYRHWKTDAYIISFPKSGRTWLRILIGKTLCEKFNLPDDIMLNTYKVTATAGIFRTQITHDSSSEKAGYKYNELRIDKKKYSKKKVVFLVRNVKDVLVSYYFQVTKRRDRYVGNISNFIRSDEYGIKKILTFYNIWHENFAVPKEFLLLRYEDLHKNPGGVLVKTMAFLGCDEIQDYIIKKAVEFASFNNMRKIEQAGLFKSGAMRPANINDEESYKLRKGIIGGYRQYLSEEDINYIDEVIKEMGCPFDDI
jgi:hypothetical protein